ncbi:MAG: hypothetical protein WBW49_22795 [Candidatus Acidiferrum sp.]
MIILRNRWIQLTALVALLAGIGARALRLKYCVTDYDTWWHLKVGDWIIQHSGLPHTGILSRTAADRAWVAYSWGYEVLLSLAYSSMGLLGIGIFGTALTVGVAFAAYWMLLRISGRFWLAWILAGITCAAFLFDGSPRPGFFSYIFYCIVLARLFEVQRTARVRLLYWLPPLFVLWANLHIQFVYGLFVVGLFVGVHVSQEVLWRLNFRSDYLSTSNLPAKPLVLVAGLCVLATFVGPNFYHPYLVVLAYSKAKFAYNVILELQPLSFRILSNYIELLLAAAGFYAVGWQKKIDPFKLALLAVAAVVSFRTMRDAWFICFSAAACIADSSATATETAPHRSESWPDLAVVAAGLILLLFAAAPFTDFSARGLDRAISENYPVNAINSLRSGSFSGPLYNNLNWGGFLMWYLPELPVAVDGRNDLYGDELDKLFFDSQSAYASYKTDPYLNEAHLVVLDSRLPLAKILSIDPRFRLVYHDDIATVYQRQ